MKCARILEAARADHGVVHEYGYRALCALASDWLLPVRLIDGHGNLGSPDYDPANPTTPRPGSALPACWPP